MIAVQSMAVKGAGFGSVGGYFGQTRLLWLVKGCVRNEYL